MRMSTQGRKGVCLSYREISDLLAASWDHSIAKILQVCGEAEIKDIHLLNLPDLLSTRRFSNEAPGGES